MIFQLASYGLMAVATVSSFFLWPILIGVLAAIVGIWLCYKVFGWSGKYIVTGKAEEHAATVWGWLTAPFRSLTGTTRVEAKLDALAGAAP